MAVQGILPPKFTPKTHEMGTLSHTWREYKGELSLYFKASGQDNIAGSQKVSILLYQMGKQYQKVYSNELTFVNDAAKNDYDTVVAQFDDYFEPKKLVKANITKFQKRYQLPNETVAEFITELTRLAKLCDFGDLEDNMLCVQISNGLRDEHLRKKVWDEDLSLKQIIEKCQMFELRAESSTVADIHYTSRRRGGSTNFTPRDAAPPGIGRAQSHHRGFNRGRGTAPVGRGAYRGQHRGQFQGRGRGRGHSVPTFHQQKTACTNCNTVHQPRQCPAYNKLCNHCNIMGHFKVACRKLQAQRQRGINIAETHQGQTADKLAAQVASLSLADSSTSQADVNNVYLFGIEATILSNVEMSHIECQNAKLSNVEKSHIECQNAKCLNVEMPHVECQNVTMPNVQNQNVDMPNVENQNVDMPNVENQNVDLPNVENQNVERSNVKESNVKDKSNLMSYVYTLSQCTNRKRCNKWCQNLKTTDGSCIHFRIDTQGDVSVIGMPVYQGLVTKPALYPSNTVIHGFGGKASTSVGSIRLPVLTQNNTVYFLQCEVVSFECPSILSDIDSTMLGLVKRVYQTMSHADKQTDGLNHHDKRQVPLSTQNILRRYEEVTQGIGCIPGEYTLKFDSSVTPVAHPPRPIPAALREAVKAKLAALERDGIIEKVPVGIPTPWCSSLHTVLKKKTEGKTDVRITIDPKDLNRALLREFHPINTVEDVITRTSGSQFFTVLDANQGFFQIKLDEKSAHLTSFNTPFGRYFYKRLPMGISSAPEIYQRAMSEIFVGLDGVEIIMDDILVHGDTLEKHNERLEKVLQRCKEKNLRLNPSKIKLAQSEVEYVGQVLTKHGVRISEDKIKAVIQMPAPSNINNVQTLLGMVNYTMKFMPNLSAITEPLRELIKESNQRNFKFHWDEVHQESFKELKRLMTTAPVLRYYSLSHPIVISCDASQSGIGMVLMQEDQPVCYGSKSLTDAEYAYSQIEKELLAIVVACRKFHTYIYGRNDVTIITDHLPLLRIIEKPLHQVPLRLQKMRMRLQQYDFKLVHRPGKEIPVPDNLSRLPLPGKKTDIPEFTVLVTEIGSSMAFSPRRLIQLQEATAKDKALQKLKSTITTGWPDSKHKLEEEVRPFWDFREELAVIDSLLFKGQRIIIPATQRREVLNILHNAHQGIVKTKQLARDLLYWPRLNAEIEEMINKCDVCQENRNYQQRETLIPMPIPKRPWQMAAQDLFDLNGTKWLILVDYYSEYFEIEKMEETNSREVIRQTKKWFACHGIPETLISDNGPPWNGYEFKRFAEQYDFTHQTISPYHSQTNGMVEKAVGIAKKLLLKCKETNADPYLALLHLRNIPRNDTTGSPAQRSMGRRTRTLVPTLSSKLDPEIKSREEVYTKLQEDRHIRMKAQYDQTARELQDIKPGDTIRVREKNKWKPAKLLPQSENLPPRSYDVQLPSGRKTRRNRRDLLKTPETDIYKPPDTVDFDLVDRQKTDKRTTENTVPQLSHTSETVTTGQSHNGTMPDESVMQPRVSRSGRVINTPSHLKDFVK
jgi:hypothetical protein